LKRKRPAISKWSSRLAVVAALVVIALLVYALVSPKGSSDSAIVARVVDGDTIKLDNGESVRYLGIDTPETVHPDKPVECYGPEATEANKQLVEGKKVRLEKDVTDRDAYGRLLRYVYVDGVFVEAELVRGGYGYVYSRQPDVKYLKQLAALEREAKEKRRGLWSACRSD
jgi:micrococcal nuclease